MRSEHSSHYTLVELLVVTGITAIFIAILTPSLGKSRTQALKAAVLEPHAAPVTSLIGGGGGGGASAADQMDAPSAARFVTEHCVGCHGPQKQMGKLRLDNLAANFDDPASARVWAEVMDNVNAGEMPPPEEPRPPAAARQQFAGWIAGRLRAADRKARSSGGRAVLRRLSRTEYANTLRDLLHMTFLPGEGPLEFLPPDGRADGFDKVSAALTIDPSLLDKYYEVAQRVARSAVVRGPVQFPTHRARFELEDTAKRHSIKYQCDEPGFQCREHDVVLMQGGTRSFDDLFYPGLRPKRIPVKGMYAVRVRAAADPGARGGPVKMRVVREGGGEGVLLEVDVTAPESSPKVYEVVLPLGVEGGEFSVQIVKGTAFTTNNPAFWNFDKAIEKAAAEKDFASVMRLRGRMLAEGTVESQAPNPDTVDVTKLPKLFLDYIEIEGPLIEQWPPKSHESLLFKGKGAAQDAAYAREIFARFMPRALRRPAAAAEVDAVVKLVADELAGGTNFEEAIRVGLTAVLTSPKFVFLFEPGAERPRPLTDWELASRLSYFLWSSMPDDALFKLAADGKLADPAVLAGQVDRMLADPKSAALVSGFGGQWLRTDEFRNFKPDEHLYKDYSDELGKSMVGQTLAFFEHVLRKDLPVSTFLDSDFTLADARLAKFYGLPGVTGDGFAVVPLPPGSPRGGLLGQAGVMLRGSDGNRTKPVTRGVYVREVLFNDPPDPPPPNVGEIEPNVEGKRLTVRDRLVQHQKVEACASCHRGIDPYGLALENFNVIGAWRDRQDGEDFRGGNGPPIDAAGRLPNGKAFADYAEFKRRLVEQTDRFRRALAEKMFTYATGRAPELADRGAIDRCTGAMTAGPDTLRTLIKTIVACEAFRTK